MKIYSTKNNTLSEIKSKTFRLEKDIQNLVEENLETLFGYDKIKSEFSIGDYRIDTLCYDKQNKSFIILEYKKDKNFSVIDQGFSYLSVVLDNRSDLILEYQEVTGKRLRKDSIDWSQTKIIFVSTSFSQYQKDSINFRDLPIELYEIGQYENNSVTLIQHLSRSSSTSIKEVSKSGMIGKVSKQVKVYTEEDHLVERKGENYKFSTPSNQIKELYFKYKNNILNNFENVEMSPKKFYLGFYVKGKIVVDFTIMKNSMKMTLNMKKGELDDKKGLCRDVSEIGHWGNGDYQIKVSDDKNFEYILSLIRQSYEKNSSS
jgi:predicted transport protein